MQSSTSMLIPAQDAVPQAYMRRPPLPTMEILPRTLTPALILQAQQDQADFERSFPPLRSSDPDLLILTWDEVERQFLNLCATWERSDLQFRLREARQVAFHQTPERILRELWVIAHCASNADSPPPRRGTGARYPMP